MTWLMIKLLLGGLWGRLRAAGATLGAVVSRNPLLALCGALALLCALFWHEWAVKARQVEHLTQTIAQFRDAQAKATQAAQDALHKQEAAYQAKAKEADDEYRTSLADARARADAYIRSHSVVGLRADGAGAARATPAAAEGDTSGSPDRSSPAPDMVVVSAGDIQVCTINTQRLQAAHDWAVTLGNQ